MAFTITPLLKGMEVNSRWCVGVSGIDTSLTDCRGRTALEILREHPAPKSQQITALIQGKNNSEKLGNPDIVNKNKHDR